MRRDEKRKTKKKREVILKLITLSFEVPIHDMNVHIYIHNNGERDAEIGEGFDTALMEPVHTAFWRKNDFSCLILFLP